MRSRNIFFGHVLIAVRQGQRRDAFATGEKQVSRYTARQSKNFWLYLHSSKLILAAKYFWRVRVVGRSFAAALTHVSRASAASAPEACGIKPRRGPPGALPGAGVWLHALGDGAHCPCVARYAAFNERIFALSISV